MVHIFLLVTVMLHQSSNLYTLLEIYGIDYTDVD